MFYKFSKKYSEYNFLFNQDDLLQECYFIFLDALNYYDTAKENKASFTTILFNFLRWKLNNIVKGKTEKQQKNYELMWSCTSLDTPIGEDNENYLIDIIPDDNSYDMPEKLFFKDVHDKLDKALNNLTLKQRNIIIARNGYYCPFMTLEELAGMFNNSKERIRQIESKVIRELQRDKELRKVYHDEFNTNISIEPPLTNKEQLKKLWEEERKLRAALYV